MRNMVKWIHKMWVFRLFFRSFRNSFRKLFWKLGWGLRSSFLSRSFWKLFRTSFRSFQKFVWRLWSPFRNSIRKSFRKLFRKFGWVLWSSLRSSFRKFAWKFIGWSGHQERLPGVMFRYCQPNRGPPWSRWTTQARRTTASHGQWPLPPLWRIWPYSQ